MNENFKILNEFKGFGEPSGKIWFIGIEEAGAAGDARSWFGLRPPVAHAQVPRLRVMLKRVRHCSPGADLAVRFMRMRASVAPASSETLLRCTEELQ